MKEWLYIHKTLIIVTIILASGGILGVFSLLDVTASGTEEDIGYDSPVEEIEKIPEELETSPEEPKLENKIRVDIKGAIKNPGVYEMSENSIINDAILLAGGLIENASTKNINLAKKVKDEMVIYIYTESEISNKLKCSKNEKNEYDGEITEEILDNNSILEKEEKTENNDLISLNKATLEELMTLDSIGASKAEKIIEYRNQQNGFKSIEELLNVSGIGEVVYEKIKHRLTL